MDTSSCLLSHRVATQGLQVQPWHAYAGIYQLRKNLMNSLDKNSSAIALPRSKSSCTRQKGTHSVGLWALHLQNAAGCCRLLQICMGVASDLHLICSFRRGCPMSAAPVAENQRVLRQNKAAPKPTAPRTSRTRSHKAGEFREVLRRFMPFRDVSIRFHTFRVFVHVFVAVARPHDRWWRKRVSGIEHDRTAVLKERGWWKKTNWNAIVAFLLRAGWFLYVFVHANTGPQCPCHVYFHVLQSYQIPDHTMWLLPSVLGLWLNMI